MRRGSNTLVVAACLGILEVLGLCQALRHGNGQKNSDSTLALPSPTVTITPPSTTTLDPRDHPHRSHEAGFIAAIAFVVLVVVAVGVIVVCTCHHCRKFRAESRRNQREMQKSNAMRESTMSQPSWQPTTTTKMATTSWQSPTTTKTATTTRTGSSYVSSARGSRSGGSYKPVSRYTSSSAYDHDDIGTSYSCSGGGGGGYSGGGGCSSSGGGDGGCSHDCDD